MPSRDDPEDETGSRECSYVATFDPADGERASETVVMAVGALTDERPADLPPLYHAVDPDALDSLCDHAQRAADRATHRLWFAYEGFDVCVRSDGEVRLLETPTTASLAVDGD